MPVIFVFIKQPLPILNILCQSMQFLPQDGGAVTVCCVVFSYWCSELCVFPCVTRHSLLLSHFGIILRCVALSE